MKTWKSFVSLGAFIGLGSISALAYAEADSFVELQLEASSAGDFIRRELSTQSTFCPQPITIGRTAGYADHLEFNQAGWFSRATGARTTAVNAFTNVQSRPVLYTQPVDVHLKTMTCVNDPKCTITAAVPGTVTYELYVNAASQVCLRNYGASGLPAGVRAPELQVCLPFDAAAAARSAGMSDAAPSGSAVTLSGDGGRLAERIEVGRTKADYDTTRIQAWQRFADGTTETTGATGDWSVFIHRTLILGTLEQRIKAAHEGDGSFRIDGPITASWGEHGDAGAEVSIKMNGILSISICPNDLHIDDITVTGTIDENAGAAPTGLLTKGSVHYQVNEADARLCGLVLGGPGGAAVFAAVADSIKVDLDLGPNCSVDGELGFSCDQPTHPQAASVGPAQVATSDLGHVIGSSSGLAMNGGVKSTGPDKLAMGGKASAWGYDALTRSSKATFQVSGTGRLCGTSFWADQSGDVSLLKIGQPSFPLLPATYPVELPASNKSAYAARPFHLMATTRTSAGVRTYAFEIPR